MWYFKTVPSFYISFTDFKTNPNPCSFERAAWIWDVSTGVPGDVKPRVAGQTEQEVHQGAGQVGDDRHHHQDSDWPKWWSDSDSQPDETKVQYLQQVCI